MQKKRIWPYVHDMPEQFFKQLMIEQALLLGKI